MVLAPAQSDQTGGAGQDQLDEWVNTYNYYSTNVYANYDETFGDHHVSGTAGFNYEKWASKNISAWGQNLSSINLDDLNLVSQNSDGETLTGVGGGQNDYALAGFFGRINYDYKGKQLVEKDEQNVLDMIRAELGLEADVQAAWYFDIGDPWRPKQRRTGQ